MSYKYTSPEDKGFGKRVNMKKKDVEKLLGRHRGLKGFRYEVYENEKSYYIEMFLPLWKKIVSLILYPFVILICGIWNIKEINREYYEIFNEKKTGSFFSMVVDKKEM